MVFLKIINNEMKCWEEYMDILEKGIHTLDSINKIQIGEMVPKEPNKKHTLM